MGVSKKCVVPVGDEARNRLVAMPGGNSTPVAGPAVVAAAADAAFGEHSDGGPRKRRMTNVTIVAKAEFAPDAIAPAANAAVKHASAAKALAAKSGPADSGQELHKKKKTDGASNPEVPACKQGMRTGHATVLHQLLEAMTSHSSMVAPAGALSSASASTLGYDPALMDREKDNKSLIDNRMKTNEWQAALTTYIGMLNKWASLKGTMSRITCSPAWSTMVSPRQPVQAWIAAFKTQGRMSSHLINV